MVPGGGTARGGACGDGVASRRWGQAAGPPRGARRVAAAGPWGGGVCVKAMSPRSRAAPASGGAVAQASRGGAVGCGVAGGAVTVMLRAGRPPGGTAVTCRGRRLRPLSRGSAGVGRGGDGGSQGTAPQPGVGGEWRGGRGEEDSRRGEEDSFADVRPCKETELSSGNAVAASASFKSILRTIMCFGSCPVPTPCCLAFLDVAPLSKAGVNVLNDICCLRR